MIKKDIKKFKDGSIKTFYRYVEGYRDENKKSKKRTIKAFGYIEDAENKNKFLEDIKWFEKEFKQSKKRITTQVDKYFDEIESNILFNYGYRFLEAVYNSLNLDEFINSLEIETSETLKILVINSIFKTDTLGLLWLYDKNTTLSLIDVNKTLSIIDKYEIEIQKYLNEKTKNLIEINKSGLDEQMIFENNKAIKIDHFIIKLIASTILSLLQLRLIDLSTERIVRALFTCQCLYEPINDKITVLKNESLKEYTINKNKKHEKYNVLYISSENETLKDFLKILEIFKLNKPKVNYTKHGFDNYLKMINFI